MKVWRLHRRGDISQGPYRGTEFDNPDIRHLLRYHESPLSDAREMIWELGLEEEGQAELGRVNALLDSGWICGWSSEGRMNGYVADWENWQHVLEHYEVSVLEAPEYTVFTDGQVLFDPRSAVITDESFRIQVLTGDR